MKTKIIFLSLFAVVILSVFAVDIQNQVIRYRGGTALKFDPQSSIQDEDAAWSIGNSQLGKLAVLQSGKVSMGNLMLATNAFTTSFSVAPVVILTAGTNDLPFLSSVTASNFIVGVAQTNGTVHWIAIGNP